MNPLPDHQVAGSTSSKPPDNGKNKNGKLIMIWVFYTMALFKYRDWLSTVFCCNFYFSIENYSKTLSEDHLGYQPPDIRVGQMQGANGMCLITEIIDYYTYRYTGIIKVFYLETHE